MTALLHGQKINAFEQGYAAFIAGKSLELNPFCGDKAPYSRREWNEGWNKAQREAWSKS